MTSTITVIQYLKLPVSGKQLYSLYSFTLVVFISFLFLFCFVPFFPLLQWITLQNVSRRFLFFFFAFFASVSFFFSPFTFHLALCIWRFSLQASKSLPAFPYRQPHLLDCLSRLRLFFPFNLQCFPNVFLLPHFSVLYVFSFLNNQHLSYSLLFSYFYANCLYRYSFLRCFIRQQSLYIFASSFFVLYDNFILPLKRTLIFYSLYIRVSLSMPVYLWPFGLILLMLPAGGFC